MQLYQILCLRKEKEIFSKQDKLIVCHLVLDLSIKKIRFGMTDQFCFVFVRELRFKKKNSASFYESVRSELKVFPE